MTDYNRQRLLRRMFDAALSAAQPALCLPAHLPGPTVADPSTCADALAILRRYRIDAPVQVQRILDDGEGESVKPGDTRLLGHETHTITAPQIALEAAAAIARNAGLVPYILGDSLEGEARELGKAMAGIGRQVVVHGQPFEPPCVLLSGGETTVTLKGNGRGGRNVEFCCRWRSSSTGCRACTPSQLTPTAWMAPKKSPVRFSRPTRSRKLGSWVSKPAPAWMPTTAMASSRLWATRSSPARRRPM